MDHPSGSSQCAVFQAWSKAQQTRHAQAIEQQMATPRKIIEVRPSPRNDQTSGTQTWAGVVKRQLVQVLPEGEERVVCNMPPVPASRKKNKPQTNTASPATSKQAPPSYEEISLGLTTLRTFWSGIKFFVKPWLDEHPEVARLVELLGGGDKIESLLQFLAKQKHNV